MTFEYSVPNGKGHAPLRLYAVQGEAGARTFTINFPGVGAIPMATAHVYVKKNDGTLVIISATPGTTKVTFTLPLQACTCPGENWVYIQMLGDGVETRWDNIILYVEPCDLENAVASTDDLGPLGEIFTDPEYIAGLIAKLESSESAVESLLDSFVPLGEYSAEAQYKPFNIVAYEGSSYINTSASLGIPPTDAGHWKLLVSNATPGPQGPQGPRGAGPCRVVVASSQSGWTANDCDYLCDGTADEEEINQAVQAAYDAGGGEVLLLEGQYQLAGPIAFPSGKEGFVSLAGNGRGTNVKGYTASTSFTNNPLIRVDAPNVTIRGLRLYGSANTAGIAVQGRGAEIDRVYCEGMECGAYVNGEDARITNCVLAPTACGIYMPVPYNGVFIGGNSIGGRSGSGTLAAGIRIGGSGTGRCVITGNDIFAVTGIERDAGSVSTNPVENLSILSNYIEGEKAIYLPDTCRCSICGNQILCEDSDEAFGVNIRLVHSSRLPNGHVISGNGIYCKNTFDNPTGILIGGQCAGVAITGNSIDGFANGMNIAGTDSVISGNRVAKKGMWGAGDKSIACGGSKNLVVGNHCDGKAPEISSGNTNADNLS